jgi:drug/metabolite transporter (DMT)-like permease
MAAQPLSHRPAPAPLIAAFWAFGAVCCFVSMAVAGREAGQSLDTFEIMTYRSFIGIGIVVAVLLTRGGIADIRTNRLGLHALRNVFHFTGQNLWFYALTVIPLAQVAVLEFSYPVWVALAAPFFLGETLTTRRIVAVLLGFAGILLVVRPGMVPLNAGTLAALACAFGFAGSALITRKLTQDQSTLCILFWLTVMQAIMGLAFAGYDGAMTWPGAETWPWVILIGVTGLGAHFCLTTALSLAPATLVTPVEFLRLPLIAGAGALIYLEPFDPFVLIGSGVIFAANLLNLWRPRHTQDAAPSPGGPRH